MQENEGNDMHENEAHGMHENEGDDMQENEAHGMQENEGDDMNENESHSMQENEVHEVEESLQSIDSILQFWFGYGRTATEIADEKTELWWSKNYEVDQDITRRFSASTEAVMACSGQSASDEPGQGAESPLGLLAAIICTDQFPRNMYRDTARAYAYDSFALQLAKHCVDSGADQHLTPIQRVFAYLPFEHSEELKDQKRSMSLYQELAKNADASERDLFDNYLYFAKKHYDIIERFGRFPHRNQVLMRDTTYDEETFLTQPSSSF